MKTFFLILIIQITFCFSLWTLRWTPLGDIFIRIEGDFYEQGNNFRLRHAFGRVKSFLGGLTWSTFGDWGPHPSIPSPERRGELVM